MMMMTMQQTEVTVSPFVHLSSEAADHGFSGNSEIKRVAPKAPDTRPVMTVRHDWSCVRALSYLVHVTWITAPSSVNTF